MGKPSLLNQRAATQLTGKQDKLASCTWVTCPTHLRGQKGTAESDASQQTFTVPGLKALQSARGREAPGVKRTVYQLHLAPTLGCPWMSLGIWCLFPFRRTASCYCSHLRHLHASCCCCRMTCAAYSAFRMCWMTWPSWDKGSRCSDSWVSAPVRCRCLRWCVHEQATLHPPSLHAAIRSSTHTHSSWPKSGSYSWRCCRAAAARR